MGNYAKFVQLFSAMFIQSMVLASSQETPADEKGLLSDEDMGEDDPHSWFARTQTKLRAQAMSVEDTHARMVELANERANVRSARSALPAASATSQEPDAAALAAKTLELQEMTAEKESYKLMAATTAEDNEKLAALAASKQEAIDKLTAEIAEQSLILAAAKGKKLLHAMAKPAVFEGGRTGAGGKQSVRDWLDSVQRYSTSANFDIEETVDFAVSFLRAEALRVWNTKATELTAKQEQPTFQHLRECLISRFDPASSSVNARFELDKLKQTGRFSNLNQYLTEFDRICSFVPDMHDAEKIHRFLSGLTNEVFIRQLTVDPLTKERYTDFSSLRHAASHVAAAFAAINSLSAGMPKGTAGQKRQNDDSKPRQNNPKRSTGGSKSNGGAGPSGLNGGGKAAPPTMKTLDTANGTVKRDTDVIGFCNGRKICANCYKQGHTTAQCRGKTAEGNPADFIPRK